MNNQLQIGGEDLRNVSVCKIKTQTQLSSELKLLFIVHCDQLFSSSCLIPNPYFNTFPFMSITYLIIRFIVLSVDLLSHSLILVL